jgi:hypothetical protein
MLNRRLALAVMCVGLLGAGCTASYRTVDAGGAAAAGARLDRAQPVLIAVPEDGRYDTIVYPGSGMSVAHQLAGGFVKYAPRVQVTPDRTTDRTKLLAAAKAGNFGYLVVPTVTRWEQRASGWSKIPSRAGVTLTVVDVASGQDLNTLLLDSQTRVMFVFSTDPESLLPQMVEDATNRLYR